MNTSLQDNNVTDSDIQQIEPPKIPDYALWSCFTLFLIFPLAGIPAFLSSNASRVYYRRGLYDMAAITSRRAFICNVIGLICFIIGALIFLIAFVINELNSIK